MVLYINPVNHAPGIQISHTPGRGHLFSLLKMIKNALKAWSTAQVSGIDSLSVLFAVTLGNVQDMESMQNSIITLHNRTEYCQKNL